MRMIFSNPQIQVCPALQDARCMFGQRLFVPGPLLHGMLQETP
jgi:hypothetical protein